MSGRPQQTPPEWATDGASVQLEPSAGRKETGWAANDRPPAKIFNWLLASVCQWVEHFALVQIKNWIWSADVLADHVKAMASCQIDTAPPTHVVVAVGFSGYIAWSSDDGLSWTNGTGLGAVHLHDVASNSDPAAPSFVAVGNSGEIRQSSDGAAWTSRTSGVASHLRSVIWDATNETFIAVGDAGVILTSPTGVTWTSRTSGTANDLWGVSAQPNGHAKACGEDRTIVRSVDGGVTWDDDTVSASGSGQMYFNICFSPGLASWVAMEPNGQVIGCAEDGSTWSDVLASSAREFTWGTLATDGGHLLLTREWSAGNGGKLIYSTDGGATWSDLSVPTTSEYGGVDYCRDAFWVANDMDIYRSLRL